jgi:hypothetical protein
MHSHVDLGRFKVLEDVVKENFNSSQVHGRLCRNNLVAWGGFRKNLT